MEEILAILVKIRYRCTGLFPEEIFLQVVRVGVL
jgi:hypothetical protein